MNCSAPPDTIAPGPAIDTSYAADGVAMASVLKVALILVAAFVLAVLLLGGIELMTLVWWKLRRCPRCRRRLALVGWDWGEWHNKNVRYSETVNGEPRDVPWVVVTCPHCRFEIALRKAPGFSAA